MDNFRRIGMRTFGLVMVWALCLSIGKVLVKVNPILFIMYVVGLLAVLAFLAYGKEPLMTEIKRRRLKAELSSRKYF